jgi:cytochrome d ubiquinol oxidase subunit II
LLAVFFGAALGTVIRGVPLGSNGYFFEPLWTTFRVGANPGILDWYTVLTGCIALVTLTLHGALYVSIKTEGDLGIRAHKIALILWPFLLVLTGLSLAATWWVRREVMDNYRTYPLGLLIPVLVLAGLVLIIWALPKGKDKLAFAGSSLYIASMLVGAVFALYPIVLPASTGSSNDLTIYNSAAGHHGLVVGISWWMVGMVLTVGYSIFIYRMFRGKVRLEQGGH